MIASLDARVVARTSSVVWAEDGSGRLLAIHDQGVEPFPFSYIVDASGIDGRPGQCLTVAERDAVPRKHTELPHAELDPSVVLSSLPPVPAGLADLAALLWMTLISDSSAGASVVGDLIGAGPGLTPEADDLVVGALAALRVFASCWSAPFDLASAVAETDLEARTSRPSAALLRSALKGRFPPALTALFLALHHDHEVPRAVSRVGAIGDSTGPALLAGVGVVVELVHDCRRTRGHPA